MGNCLGTTSDSLGKSPDDQKTCRAPVNCTGDVKKLIRPKWKSDKPMTKAQLDELRAVFWDTEPHYGGNALIWDALKAASQKPLSQAVVIIESAGVIVAAEDMTVCYDVRGSRYEFPLYIWCDPANLISEEDRPMQIPDTIPEGVS
jgi:hypothetical protein